MPAVGLGTWITFNVGNDPVARDASAEVIRAFFAAGGRMIESSPIAGCDRPWLAQTRQAGFAPRGRQSMDILGGTRSRADRGVSPALAVPRFDLLQVHNLLSWEEHLPTLLRMKVDGLVPYVGITTSEGRRHSEVERIMMGQRIDFVQVTTTYSTVRSRRESCRWQASVASA